MVEQEIYELENSRYRAMVSNDLITLDRVLADDLLYTHSSAVVDNKASYLEALRSGATRYLSAERQQDSLRIYGDVIVIQGRMKAHVIVNGTEKSISNVFTCIWARKPAGWQMVNWSSTPIPAAHPAAQPAT